MTQSIFKFPSVADYSAENFLVSDSNKEAYDYVGSFPWDSYALNIYGAKSCGKTYLAFIVNEISSGTIEIIDEVESDLGQEDLLHKLNVAKEEGRFVLLTSAKPVTEMGFTLPDLTSRLAAIQSIEIKAPDENLIYMLLARHFNSRQLKISDDVLNFMATRIDRNFPAIYEAVEKIDNLSLQEKRDITIPLIKKVL